MHLIVTSGVNQVWGIKYLGATGFQWESCEKNLEGEIGGMGSWGPFQIQGDSLVSGGL